MIKLDKGGSKNPEYAFLYNRKTTFDDGKSYETPRYDRNKLLSGDEIEGPASITQHNSTTIIPPLYIAEVLNYGDIRIQKIK